MLLFVLIVFNCFKGFYLFLIVCLHMHVVLSHYSCLFVCHSLSLYLCIDTRIDICLPLYLAILLRTYSGLDRLSLVLVILLCIFVVIIFVPCFPSAMVKGIATKYMDDDDLWLDYRTTRDRLNGLSRDTGGKVLSKPHVKIIEGVETPTAPPF